MNADKCAVHTCNRPRRDGRPICNRCMRRAGETLVHRWFGYRRAIAQHPGVPHYTNRIITLENQMITNATAYQQIRQAGQHPIWNTAGERWEEPRTRAYEILERTIATHQFGRDVTNDEQVLDRVVAELFPAQ